MTEEDRMEGLRLLEAWERCYNYDQHGNKMWDDPTEEQVAKAHDGLADFLLTHARALLDDGWRTMETAPKGDWVIIGSHELDKFGQPNIERAQVGRDGISRICGRSGQITLAYWATHWQPLPTPPATHKDTQHE